MKNLEISEQIQLHSQQRKENIIKGFKENFEKGFGHKYIKRTGSPGHYKYEYSENSTSKEAQEKTKKVIENYKKKGLITSSAFEGDLVIGEDVLEKLLGGDKDKKELMEEYKEKKLIIPSAFEGDLIMGEDVLEKLLGGNEKGKIVGDKYSSKNKETTHADKKDKNVTFSAFKMALYNKQIRRLNHKQFTKEEVKAANPDARAMTLFNETTSGKQFTKEEVKAKNPNAWEINDFNDSARDKNNPQFTKEELLASSTKSMKSPTAINLCFFNKTTTGEQFTIEEVKAKGPGLTEMESFNKHTKGKEKFTKEEMDKVNF